MTTHRFSTLAALVALVLAAPAAVYGQTSQPDLSGNDLEKRAQTGMKFLTVSTDPRAAALGNAAVALEWGSSAMFYNTAGMARLEGNAHLAVGNTQWLADINYYQASLALNPFGGRYGVLGVLVQSVDYGEFEETIRADNEEGFVDIGTYSPSALAVGLGYAKALTDRFAVGGNVKYVRQDLGSSIMDVQRNRQSNLVSTPAFDFGVLYRTGFRSLNFAVSARNFSQAVEVQEETFELPVTVSVGVAMDLVDLAPSSLADHHALLLSVETAHPRDFSETISVGAEYVFMDVLALRAGYVNPSDEQGLSLGSGLNLSFGGFAFQTDYAYTRFGRFGSVNRIAMQLGF